MGMSVGNNGGGEDAEYRPISEINITPFVDVMLVLLIIFMVTAPLLVAGVPVNLPSTSATKLTNNEPKKPVIVTMKEDGSLFIRKEPATEGTLISKLTALHQLEGDAVVYVRADKGLAYGEVMEILGLVGQSGYSRVSLLSEHKAKRDAAQPSP